MYPNKLSISLDWRPIIFEISTEENELKPLANSLFSLSTILIWSPLLKFPDTFFIPAASKLFPLFKANLAPSSIISSPLGEIELIIHFFLASNLEIFGRNQVQLFCLLIFFIGLSGNPLAIAILHPDSWQILAASILVFIPPVPYSLVPFVAVSSIFIFIFLTSFINFAPLFIFGFLVYKPSTSDSNISESALEIWATLDANLSLSPYLISEVAILSFSFTTGIKFNWNKFSKVLFAFKALLLCSVSSRVSKIWDILILDFIKILENKFI